MSWRPHPGPQTEFLSRGEFEVLFGGAAGPGKMLALDLPVPTPDGWSTMGDLRPGDVVFGEHGQPVTVLIAHPVDPSPITYELTFDDGSKVKACADHLWLTFDAMELAAITRRSAGWRERRQAKRKSRVAGNKSAAVSAAIAARNRAYRPPTKAPPAGSVRSTADIATTLRTARGRANHAMPVAGALDLPAATLALDPYLLGLWLGDGTSAGGSITSADQEIVAAFQKSMAAGFVSPPKGKARTYGVLGLASVLRGLGVLCNKHIPIAYLRASKEQRLTLLAGLLDSDGTVSRTGNVDFDTTNRALADGVFELVASMGWKPSLAERRATLYGKDCGPKWHITWTPDRHVFRLERKRSRQRLASRRTTRFRYVVSAERVDPVPMRCITVDNPSGLFLAGRAMLVTHNSECLVTGATRRVANPRYRGLIIRRTFPQLREIIDRCFRYYPGVGGVYRATEHRWVFPSGATIELGHMQHEADRYNYQGREFQFIGVDELTHFTEVQYTYLMSRCRSTDPTLPAQMRATTNPGGIGHRWVKQRFVDPVPARRTYIDPDTGLSRAFVPARITDNPTLVEADPAYLARLRALPEVERRRLLDGDWESFEGQVFRELSTRLHARDPFVPPPEWHHFAVMDWGFAKPFSIGWYAVDYDDVLYRYAEWYGCKLGDADVGLRMTALDVAKGLLERERDLGIRPRVRYADPSIFNALVNIQTRAREVVGGSVAEDMASQGLHWLRADNDRMHGIQQVHKRFQADLQVDPQTGEVTDERPRFVCTTNCEAFWRTVPTLQASERDAEDIDTRQEDHCYDEFRYACMSRPLKPRAVVAVASGTFSSERSRFMRAKDYAKRYGVTIEAAYQRIR